VKAASIWTAHRFTSPQYCTCENFATRFRIGELPEVQTKSSALGHCCKRQVSLDSGKDIPAKRLAYSKQAENHGGLDPPLAKPNWMVMQIYAPLCHKPETVNWTTQKNGGDASWPLVKKGGAVNMI